MYYNLTFKEEAPLSSKKNTEKLWSGYFIMFLIIGFVISTAVFLLDNILSIYANDVWGSKSAGGLLTTTFTFGSIIATAVCGVVIDRTGRKRAIIFGFGIFTVGIIGMAIFKSQGVSYVMRVLQGVGKGVGGVAMASAVADVVPKNRMGEGMGYYGLGSTLAQAIGPSLGLALIATGNYTLTFCICAAGYLASTVAGFFINYEKDMVKPETALPDAPAQKTAPADAKYHGIWKLFEKAALPATLVMFMYGAGCTPILIYITLYATDVLEVGTPGIFFFVSAAAMLITRFTIGKLIDKRGVLGIVVFGNILGILSNVLLLVCKSDLLYYLDGAVYGFATAMIYPALQAAVIVDSPDDRRGAANSLMNFGLDFGILCASALFGVLLENVSWVAVFVGGALFYAVGAVLTAALLTNSARKKRREKIGIFLETNA
jgi:predicted MFS family arabinose efflux permease